MKIIENEHYEELAAEWQYQMIMILKKKLKENNIEDCVSEKICGDFTFDFAMMHDQGKIDGHRPVICFDNHNNDLLYNSGEDFDLHDYAFGNTSEAFEK